MALAPTTVVDGAFDADLPRRRPGGVLGFLKTFRRQRLGMIGVAMLSLTVIAAIGAPWIAPYDPTKIDTLHLLESPSASHWLGTDGLGRDVFSRILYGAQVSLYAGFLVVCTGGGGIPVVEDRGGRQRGVEAVIDKDLASALLAADLHADALVLATDVDAVYRGYGTASQRPVAHATPAGLRSQKFAPGSMGPKVEAACRFVERTGARAAIGSLEQVDALLSGRSGTQVLPDGPDLQLHEERTPNDRAA